jgi:RNA polymerase sigma-70 factor (ECF subfamily)
MARIPATDQELFDCLFERHRHAVFGYLYGQTGRRDAAFDLLQDTFVRVWRHIADARSYDEHGRMAWLLCLARSASLDSRRRTAVRTNLQAPMPKGREPASAGHEAEVLERMTLERVDTAIRALPVKYRTVLTMTVLGGLTSEEIGTLLNRPPATVRYQLAEARKRIARKVEL